MNLIKEIKLFFSYGLVGLVNTGLTALLIFLFSLTHLDIMLYTSFAYICGMIQSYFLNRFFTFKGMSRTQSLTQALKFFLVSIVSLCAALLSLQFLKNYLAQWLAQGIGMVFYTGISFLINRLWIFGTKND